LVYDFVRKLLADPTRLEVLGDGRQSKSYIHVDDVLDAVLMLAGDPPEPFDVFNAATEDYVTVREIAGLVVDAMGLDDVAVQFGHSGRGEGRRPRRAPLVRQAARAGLEEPLLAPGGAGGVGAGAARVGQAGGDGRRGARRARGGGPS
jgi:nucleoside-diphosphate-sugar epimerase